jgi:hypothetical protein
LLATVICWLIFIILLGQMSRSLFLSNNMALKMPPTNFIGQSQMEKTVIVLDNNGTLSTRESDSMITSVQPSTEQLHPQQSISVPLSGDGNLPEFCVDYKGDDPENARNWSVWYQMYAIVAITYTAWATVLYSTCYSSGIPGMMAELGIASETIANLGISLYLVGWSIGSLVLAPLSETFGRRPVYIVSLLVFVGLIPACALANSFAATLTVRVLG